MDFEEKFFKVWPDQRDLIRRTPLAELAQVVAKLQVPESPGRKRAIRCRVPQALKELLEEVSRDTERPMVDILLRAARRYRELNPADPEWQKPAEAELVEYEERNLRQMVLFLDEEDRELIQHLGRGVAKVIRRRDAFDALIPIIRQMTPELDADPIEQRVSLRIKIPADVHSEIVKHTEKGFKYVQVLLAACRQVEAAR